MIELIAHQGGWDEILMVAGPLAVFGGVLWLANRRATQHLASAEAETDDTDSDGDPAHESPD